MKILERLPEPSLPAHLPAMKPLARVEYLVVHCSAEPAYMPKRDSNGQLVERTTGAKEINQWHVRDRGWLMIGYHFVIKRDGTIERGRPLSIPGAHVVGHNQHSVGICMIGGTKADGKTPENNFNEAQFASLKALLIELREKYPNAKIVGHRDLAPGRGCPSFEVRDWCASEGIKQH